MKAIAAFVLFILLPLGAGFDISPANPQPGDRITLTGSATPDEQVPFRSSFSLNLPVTAGQYHYETSVEIPQRPNSFTVTARNVQDLNAGVKMGIWLTKRFQGTGGMASISQEDVPPGRYDIKIFGEAVSGAAAIPVEVVAETAIKADSEGGYNLVIDTSGMPEGDLRIQGAGDAKTIRLGGPAQSSSGEEEELSPVYAEPEIRQVEITPEVVAWYADQIGLDPQEERQYAEAEGSLEKRLSGGYWKVIAKGEPLTEEAGNCEQKYCLVRGVDACTVCREKDMLLRGNESLKADTTPQKASAVPDNIGLAGAQPAEKKGFINMIIGWVMQMLRINPGG